MRLPFDPEFFAANRDRLFDALRDEEAVLLFGSPHHLRNGDAEYRFRQHSDVYYLTGWEDPEVAVLFRPQGDHRFVMFVQPRNPEMEVWTGKRIGPEGAVSTYGADAAHPYSALAEKLPDLLLGVRTLHYRWADDPAHDSMLAGALGRARRKARKTRQDVPDAFIDPNRVIHELRMLKRPAEIEILRRAAEITGDAHRAAMAMTAPGVMEYQLEAEIDRIFRASGGNGPGYSTIVGGGANATVLHYVTNHCALRDGDVVCVDAGCEYGYYTADVTRSWPVNGRFTKPQRELYQLVLDAELAAIAEVKAGNPWKAVHDAATKALVEGMLKLKLLEGDWKDPAIVDAIIEAETHKKYYMHGTSHWLGLDVHDVGVYHRAGESRVLQPGMLMTVEPGVYVAEDDETAPEKYRGIGIRIEDDVLCTEGEPDVLTASIPKTIKEIETLVGTRAASGLAAR